MHHHFSTQESPQISARHKAGTLRQRLLGLPRNRKRLLQLLADTVLIWTALWLSFYLRLDDAALFDPTGDHAWLFILAPIIALPTFYFCGLYKTVMRYAGMQSVAVATFAIVISTTLLGVCVLLHPTPETPTPRSIVIFYGLLSVFFIAGLRLLMRQYFLGQGSRPAAKTNKLAHSSGSKQIRVAIYGAGAAGNQLLMALRLGHERWPVAFLDDNPDLSGRVIAGVPVHQVCDLQRLIHLKNIKEVLLAVPSAPRNRRAQIIRDLSRHNIGVRMIPGLMDVASGRVKVQDLRDVDISDLLGRDPVQPQADLLERCIKHKVVLVTGAGGSIGAELCRQIVQCLPRRMLLVEHSEFNLYSIQKDLETHILERNLDIELLPILGTVCDEDRLFELMSIWEVDTVYHAAAYKHVPMVERNITAGISNNVFGTLYCAQAAIRAGVSSFVLISTDKAVRPTSTMGSTKRLAELILQALSQETSPTPYGAQTDTATHNPTRFTMVRFGNVLDSSGSVIPLFREQIRNGGPITVTHRDITRYFMTIPEASQLVIQAGSMGVGGDVFVLDMGEPVKILDLAINMIKLSGLSVESTESPSGDIPIHFTGLRPGEKLFEELLIGEHVTPTRHPKIKRANEQYIAWASLKLSLANLEQAIGKEDYASIRQIFFRLVEGYAPDEEMADWLHMQSKAKPSQLSPTLAASVPIVLSPSLAASASRPEFMQGGGLVIDASPTRS